MVQVEFSGLLLSVQRSPEKLYTVLITFNGLNLIVVYGWSVHSQPCTNTKALDYFETDLCQQARTGVITRRMEAVSTCAYLLPR